MLEPPLRIIGAWSFFSESYILTPQFIAVISAVFPEIVLACVKFAMSFVRHGIGREVDDDELFGDDTFPIMRQTTGWPSASDNMHTAPTVEPDVVLVSDRRAKRPRTIAQPSTLSARRDVPVRNASHASKDGVAPRWAVLRSAYPRLPESLRETVAEFTLPGDDSIGRRIDGAPRLSTLARLASASLFTGGKYRDLSKLCDYHAFALLTGTALNANTVIALEECNPTRVRLLDAVWATVVNRVFKIDVRPSTCESWRAVFEQEAAVKEERLRRTRERIREGYAQKSNKKITTKLDSRRSRTLEPVRRSSHGSESLTRIDRLRLQARKDRRRRMR